MQVGVVSLGCAKNLVDSEVILGLLDRDGFTITNQEKDADILIVNTCGFIESAKQESIQTILELAKYKETGKCRALIVTGCLAQKYKNELLEELPEVDGIVGTGEVPIIVEIVNRVIAGERVAQTEGAAFIYSHDLPRLQATPSYTAYVKIAEGCDNCCSYCVIPELRGRFRSRPIDSVLKEIEYLADRGVKEINLIAQDTTGYGRDLEGRYLLTDLLKEAVKISGIEWFRLLYCYPTHFTGELIELIAKEPKVCNYLDIPLQHVNNDILKQMNRPDSKEAITNLMETLRRDIPDLSLRTTFIVGFPGETEEQFQELLDFIEKIKFDRVGVFTYSQEEGTRAAGMENQIAGEVKEDRLNRAMKLQKKISAAKNKELINKTFSVLIEGKSTKNPELVFGRTERDAPDIDGRIYFKGQEEPGQFVRVKVTSTLDYDLIGEVTCEPCQ